MDAFEIDISGSVNHRQTGAKSTIGVASDQIVVYYNPDELLVARDTIERATRLHQFAKELKSGMVRNRGVEAENPLATIFPGSAK